MKSKEKRERQVPLQPSPHFFIYHFHTAGVAPGESWTGLKSLRKYSPEKQGIPNHDLKVDAKVRDGFSVVGGVHCNLCLAQTGLTLLVENAFMSRFETASQYRLTPHLSTVNDHLISQAKATECLLPQIFRHWWSWPLAWCMSCPQREGKGEKQSQVSAESPLLIVVCCWTSQQGLVLGGVYRNGSCFGLAQIIEAD